MIDFILPVLAIKTMFNFRAAKVRFEGWN